jgi:hypothetical protein
VLKREKTEEGEDERAEQTCDATRIGGAAEDLFGRLAPGCAVERDRAGLRGAAALRHV